MTHLGDIGERTNSGKDKDEAGEYTERRRYGGRDWDKVMARVEGRDSTVSDGRSIRAKKQLFAGGEWPQRPNALFGTCADSRIDPG